MSYHSVVIRLLVLLTVIGGVNSLMAQPEVNAPYCLVLGTAQDGGYPQAGCRKPCCRAAHDNTERVRYPASLAVIDPTSNQRWVVECTPRFPAQLALLNRLAPQQEPSLDGVLLTHAHIGHYAGLIHLGREVMGASSVPVFVMPRMRKFLTTNGPWDQLVKLKNIELRNLADGQSLALNARLNVMPLQVPHRDEYSETVGFVIAGPNHKVLFLPDIDKWDRWSRNVDEVIRDVDVAYVDGTFYADGELPGRDMSKIPHPFIAESISRWKKMPTSERHKVRFIHLNHTNPALDSESDAYRRVHQAGFRVAEQGERVGL